MNMAKLFGLDCGAVVIGTDKGLLQIYIKDTKAIVTLESSRSLVTYAKSFDLNTVISPFVSLLSRVLPSYLSLNLIGHEFGKRETIVLEDDNERFILANEGIKKGDKKVRFSTYSNSKVINLFDEYERNPRIFSGFCNYKIDSLGNIDNREIELMRELFRPKYSFSEFLENEKTKEALLKESATEKYLSKIYKEYVKEDGEEIDDIQKIGFKKIKNMFSEVNDSLKENKKEDIIDALERARTNIIARNKAIPNILKYIGDSRIEGNYMQEEISQVLAMIYVQEKLELYGVSPDVEEKFSNSGISKKLKLLLEEDVIRSYKKEDRCDFEELLPIKFARARVKICDLSEKEESKVISVLKRYVDLIECMDFFSDGESKVQVLQDELAIIVKNYDNYLGEGVLSMLGIEPNDTFVTIYRNLLKEEIIKDKTGSNEVIAFSHVEDLEEENEEVIKESEYIYLVKDNQIHMFKDNMYVSIISESDMKEKYGKYIEESEIKKQSLLKLANKKLVFLPFENGVAQIRKGYGRKEVIEGAIYMQKTVEEEKDINRTSYLEIIAKNLKEAEMSYKNIIGEDFIYEVAPDQVLEEIERRIDNMKTLKEGEIEILTDKDSVSVGERTLAEAMEITNYDESNSAVEATKDDSHSLSHNEAEELLREIEEFAYKDLKNLEELEKLEKLEETNLEDGDKSLDK